MTQKHHVMHGRDHLPQGADPIPGVVTLAPAPAFYDAVLALADTSDLRGYWRLGDGGLGPYADSKPALSSWANAPMTRVDNSVDMTDVAGALAVGDDGAVQFNSSSGALTSDWLSAPNTWGAGTSNPFEWQGGAVGWTVCGWVKPGASGSTFDGGIFSTLANAGVLVGYGVGVAWPSRTVYFQVGATRLNSSVIPADEWTFVCAVHDATSNRIYLDGGLAATGASLPPWGGANIDPLIGLWNYSAGTTGVGLGVLYGAVDEVAVFGAALTPGEISTLYTAGVSSSSGNGTGGVVVDTFSAQGEPLLTGDVTISAGTNVTLAQSGQNVEIAAAGFDPGAATSWWFPLVDSDGTVVLDGDGNLIPTLIPL